MDKRSIAQTSIDDCPYARFRPQPKPSADIPLGARSVGHHQVKSGWLDDSFQIEHVVFLWSIRGQGNVGIDDQFEILPPNHIAVLLPGLMQRLRATSVEQWEYCWWTMDGPSAESLTTGFGFTEPGIQKAGPPPLDLVFRLDQQIRRPGLPGEIQASATAYQLLATAARECRPGNSHLEDPLQVRVEQLIDEHWADAGYNIDSIATATGVHRSTLSRRFHAATGMTLVSHLTSVRLQNAMNLLKTTSLSICEIAFACGFRDANYFIRVFKKQTGKTPGEFRQGM